MNMKSDKSGSRVSADVNPPLDDQQARLLSILSGRAGEPVTYTELRDAGIEFPAGLIAELELAGVEIDRCRVAVPGGRPIRAVRLPSTVEGYAPAVGEALEPPPSSEPPSSPPLGPQPPSSLAGGTEPTSSTSRRQPPAPPFQPPTSAAPPSQPPTSAAPPPQASPRDLPPRDPSPTGPPVPGSDWSPVRVYRRSLWGALAARRAKRARRRDTSDIAEMSAPPHPGLSGARRWEQSKIGQPP